MFELACFGYIEETGSEIDRRYEAPDFLVSLDGARLAIEVATANPVSRQSTDISLRSLEDLTQEALHDKIRNEFPLRMGRLLTGKRQKRYWALPQCHGLPLVIIVSPLFEAGSVWYTDDALATYLYGLEEYTGLVEHNGSWVRSIPVEHHTYKGRSITSNFFGQPDSEHVSAVIYANSFTVPKFLRISIQSGAETGTWARRKGTAIVPISETAAQLADFEYVIGSPDAPHETWAQGVTVFFNPRARVPLRDDLLACTSAFKLEGGSIVREVYDFHPLATLTTHYDKEDVGWHGNHPE
ncbi:MAG: hypothetical protein R3F14_28110 [Polyangiaceae bacterium]